MKKLFIIPTTTLTIASLFVVIILGTALTPKPALAATTYTYQNGAHPYNYVFNLRGQSRYVTTNDELRLYLEDLIRYIQQVHDSIPTDTYSNNSNNATNQGDISVTTQSATSISRNGATLHGDISDLNGFNAADVWFEFGKNSRSLSNTSDAVRISRNSNSSFELPLSGLIDGTTYYFQAVASDNSGNTSYGSILRFTTDSSGNNSSSNNSGTIPDATTKSAVNVTTHSADLRGSIDMNDFSNGRIFFVYGENRTMINNVPNDFNTYTEVSEDGDNLQKISVDTSLDGTSSYDEIVSGLNRDTDHYYRMCVQYQDDNNDNTLECGSVMNFTTIN